MPGDDNGSGRIARSVTANPAFVLTALGLILYAILRLANSLFYTPLKVKPEEVGLGYADTVSQSAVGVLVVVGFGFAVIGVLVFFLVYVFPASLPELRSLAAPSTLEKILLASAMAAYLAAAATISAVWGWREAGNIIGIIGMVIGAGVGAREIWRETRAGKPTRLVRSVEAVLALSAVLAVVVILVQAWQDGRGVRRGEVRHPTILGFLPFGTWGADAANVEWVEGKPPAVFASARRRCLLYLGKANGTAVFYDARVADGRTIRVPTAEVAVTTRNSRHDGIQACG